MLLAQTLIKMNLANRTRTAAQGPLSRHNVMKIHGQEWSQLSPELQGRLHKVAEQLRAEREEQQRQQIEEDHSALEMAIAKHAEDSGESQTMQMASAQLDETAVAGWERIVDADIWTSATISSMRAKAVSIPDAVEGTRFDALASQGHLVQLATQPLGHVASQLCRARDFLREAVIIVEDRRLKRVIKWCSPCCNLRCSCLCLCRRWSCHL